MAKIKIISNPYKREISYRSFKEQTGSWEEISASNENSRLREDESGKSFLPFKIKEIIAIIIDEYYVGKEKVEIVFEGTHEEFNEVEKICLSEGIVEKVRLIRANIMLENAKLILKDTKEHFMTVQPVIKKIIKDDENVLRDLNKVSDALDDIIPICVFGNYSAGKSTFINSLIGHEILPSGGDPVTAKIYRISRSEQSDLAWIRFEHFNNMIELCFEGTNFRILKGNPEDEMLVELKELMCEKADMFTLINNALEFINGFEKRNMDSIEISDVIGVEVPFAKEGVLGRSLNNFVIFDTPGSNSNSNMDHSKVLAEALQGFSNGIPVWISQYESIDSNDNAKLCNDVLNIKALDKRFTMIVLNKAESSDLPEDGFTAKQIKNILEYNSVEKMYASGIYFVSSIMGLGAKNNGDLVDKHYRRTYRSRVEMFSDPEDVDYATLYIYNIMPEQIKKEVMEYSEACSQSEADLIYANSGLYCIEQEMEDFASKYSAYNKCQMVYSFLIDVVSETERRIANTTASIKAMREKRSQELEVKKKELIDRIADTSQKKEVEFEKASKTIVKGHVETNLDYSCSVEEIDKLDEEITNNRSEESGYSEREKAYADSKVSLLAHLKANGQSLLKGNIKEAFVALKDDWDRDFNEVVKTFETKETSRKAIDEATSDDILHIVIERYKKSILEAREQIDSLTKRHWYENAQALRNELASIVTESDALTTVQREELSNIIFNYQALEFNDDADTIFIKTKFLRGNVLGIMVVESEKLSNKRLASRYNAEIKKSIVEIATRVNESCFLSFKGWLSNLIAIIEENITEYNPELRNMTEMIREETEKINELEENQKTINSSVKAIQDLMSWKVLE